MVIKLYKPKLPQQEQGFSLVEVLVAILITTLFIGIAMQTMVIATIFKAKAQEYSEATTWIQEDLEDVKYQAANLQFPQTTLTTNAAMGASSITVASGSMFATSDTLKVGLDSNNYRISGVSGNTLTITPNLASSQVTGSAVIETTMCNPSAQNVGLADALRDIVTAASTASSNYVDSTKNFRTTKTFSMRKTTTLSTDFPYNVLQVKYEVLPGSTFNSSNIIAKFDTEVIPNVAFQCS